MYKIFEKLLADNNVTAYKVSKETGIGRSTFTDWKNGRSVPGTDKMIKIAEYFGVSVEYLKTGKETTYNFSDDAAHLASKILFDKELSDALEKLLSLNDVKKKHVIETINLLSE